MFVPHSAQYEVITLPTLDQICYYYQRMQLVKQIAQAIISAIIGVHGIMKNSAILTVYIRLWRKITSPGVSDQILFTMALTSVLLQCSVLCNTYWFLFQTVNDARLLLFAAYVQFVVFSMNFWNTAWLSICYCVKLVNISHQIFFWWKKCFSSSITKLIIGSAIYSVWTHVPLFWAAHVKFFQNTNITNEPTSYKMEVNVFICMFNILISYTVPFILTFICIGLSVTSVLRHVWKIRQNVSQVSSSPQTQTLVRVAVIMALRVILDITSLILVTYMVATSFYLGPVIRIFIWLSPLSYPSVQAFIIIFGNPKLKRSLFGRESTS